MFKHIFKYEIKYWLRRPVFYIYLLVFTLVAFLSIIGTAGLFDPPANNTKIERLVNSPFELNYMLQYFAKIMLFLLPAIIGATIYKDYKNKVHSVLYSFPIHKRDYLLGKFLSALLLVFLIAIMTGLAMLIAEHVPGLHETKIGTFNAKGYIQALFIFVLPNLLFYGAIVFALVTYFRNIYAGFVVLILLFFLQNITENIFSGILIGITDPFGQNAVLYETQLWTLEDKNTKLIPFFGAVLYNRIFWLTLSSLIFGFAYKRFEFSEHASSLTFINTKKSKIAKKNYGGILNLKLPKVTYNFSDTQQLKNAWLLSQIHLKTIIKSWMFYIIVGFGILAILFAIGKVTNNNEVTILPVTNIVLTIPAFFFTTIIMLLTFIYSGMLVQKDSASNMNQLVDATPISSFALMTSKVIAIIKMQAILLVIMMIAGITIQIYNGYYHFEIGLYLFNLFIVQFIGLIIWACTSIFTHSIVKNSYLGIFILILGWLSISGIKEIGVNTRLLLFNFSEPMQYSDLNAYATLLKPYFLVKSYWLVFSIILLVIAYLMWHRGVDISFAERFAFIKNRFKNKVKFFVSILIPAIIALGLTINSEEIKSIELSDKDRNKAFSQFEVEFAKYSKIENQPRITTIDLNIDVFPKTNELLIKGAYTLVNKSSNPIDTLLVKTGFNETTALTTSKASTVIDNDSYIKFSVLKLEEALQPNDSILLDFTIKNKANTLFENNSNVLTNGTFFKNNIFPRIGYFLNSNNKFPTDSLATKVHYYSKDSDGIHLKTIISTSKDQIAIAPGYLKKQWEKDDRHYYEYETTTKIKNSLSFSSGAFNIDKENYKGVDLEIYHHKAHTYNLKSMKNGLKAALDYNSQHFGSYQFNEARIIEFPITEGTYASVMANSIPTSEMRFIANTSQESIDISFYTIAHELTHQWFGNQVVPADAFGAIMLSESITEYISLQIYREAFGIDKAHEFLNMQRKRYINGRTSENGKEPPLYLVKGKQQYLAYGKGALAFNTLSHHLGKETLHLILKTFLNDFKGKAAPYPTSVDVLERIKKSTPDALQYLITDYFETVTFHDAKVNSATINGTEITVDFSFSKKRNESKTELTPLNDVVELGFYDDQGNLISIKSVLVTSKNNRHTFSLKEKPEKIVIDPNLLLIEKNITDNTYNL